MSKNILAIGAHFDDIEIGCGGSLARLRKEGHRIHMLVMTNSAYSDHNARQLRSKQQATVEGLAGAKVLGAKLHTKPYDSFSLKFDSPLIKELNLVIEELDPKYIFTHWIYDAHQDHQILAKATFTAARKHNNIFMYRSNWYEVPERFDPNLFIDISSFVDVKRRAIRAHKNEYKKLGGEKFLDYFINESANYGKIVGVKYAEVFSSVKLVI